MKTKKVCEWEEALNKDYPLRITEYHKTSCGVKTYDCITKFCPYCGKKIKEVSK